VEISDSEYRKLKGYEEADASAWRWTKRIAGVVVGLLLVLCGLVMAWRWVMPSVNLHKAEIENQRVISKQHAESDAAVYAAKSTITQATAKASAEVERAKGAAKAQEIIANTLTEPYLRYLYITNLGTSDHEVIYLPTEAGLPILEADRFDQPTGNSIPPTSEAP
jgi:hypothetical protein